PAPIVTRRHKRPEPPTIILPDKRPARPEPRPELVEGATGPINNPLVLSLSKGGKVVEGLPARVALHRHEAQASVIGDPATVVKEGRAGQLVRAPDDLLLSFGRDQAEEVVPEHADPVGDAVRTIVERRWAVEQVHEPDLEAGPLEERRVLGDTRKIP